MKIGDIVQAIHTFQHPHLHLAFGIIIAGAEEYWRVLFGDELFWFDEKDLRLCVNPN